LATVFGKEGNDFYGAFYESDPVKRRAAFNEWIKSATPAFQAAIGEELKAFVEWVTENRWNDVGWKEGNEKLHRIQNDYPLVMDIKLRKLARGEEYLGKLPDPVVYKPDLKIVTSGKNSDRAIPAGNRSEDYDDDYDAMGSSSNDDRSDSMNPNNDDYQASIDNHSDQMNPNNDAYWSSRGR
jgi:hypothetical protein